MTDPNPDPTPPADDSSKAELEALRKEKSEREAADRAAKDAELEDLRKFKTEQEERAAKAVKAPTPKAEKTPAPVVDPEPTVKSKPGKSGASRLWFGSED